MREIKGYRPIKLVFDSSFFESEAKNLIKKKVIKVP